MDEYKTQRSVYTPNDLVLWQENGVLEISPKFQRRALWRTPARSYFIDTLLRGMTVPALYFRMAQDSARSKTIREVVDGQQRIRSVLEFIADEFRLSKSLNATWAGRRFSELSEIEQQRIMSFTFPTEVFGGISDKQVLEVFCRLNTNGIALNKQELRNGKFFGPFKNTAFDLALTYLDFWRRHKLFSEQGIARMLEVELTSELLIAGSSGMQDKKKSIDSFYETWESSYPHQKTDQKRFQQTMEVISETFAGNELAISKFRRPSLFYTLYCVVFHHMFGLPQIKRATPKRRPTRDGRDSLREAIALLSDKINESKDPYVQLPPGLRRFVSACAGQTDNIAPRQIRFDSLFDQAF